MKRNIVIILLALLLAGCRPVAETEAQSTAVSTADTPLQTEEILPLPVDTLEVPGTKYAYSTLEDEEKRIYEALYTVFSKGIFSFETDIDPELLSHVFSVLYRDCPEFFCLTGECEINDGVFRAGIWTFGEERAELEKSLQAVQAKVLSATAEGFSDYDKLLYAFCHTGRSAEYSKGAYAQYEKGKMTKTVYRSLCALGPLVDGAAICEGYAEALVYLFQSMGFASAVVPGHTSGGYHAWTVVEIMGECYIVDPTWGDPTSSTGDNIHNLNYYYFCATDKEIAGTHTPDSPYAVPSCQSYKLNYFINEGLYLTECDTEAVYKMVCDARDKGLPSVSVLFDDTETGNDTYKAIKLGAFTNYPGAEDISYTVTYSKNKKILTVTFR